MLIFRPLGIVLLVLVTPLPAADVPTFEKVTGHAIGTRIALHHEMLAYLARLDQDSPRVKVVQQGHSWEQRALPVAIVTSAENHRRLDEIQRRAQLLGDPRRADAVQVNAWLRDQPTVLWLGGSIHGFELSGSEALLKLLEHLTTRDDAETRAVLASAVILIDPMLNPDGREAFAHTNHENIGRTPNPNRDDWANDFTRWDGLKYRTGHYYFDTNRDWFAHTQRETQARVPTIVAWRPQVVIDLHEMGADVEFFFDPPATPVAPHFPDFASRWFEILAKAHADAFDGAGFEYMTRERYNYFYPAYTTSYGSYQGAVGMLYEQGSSRGLALHRADRSVRSLADATAQHYTAAWAAVRAAAGRREQLLRDYHDSLRRDIEAGRRGHVRYLIARGRDPGREAELAALLRRNGVEVSVLSEDARLNDVRNRIGENLEHRRFPAGTYLIEAAQPHQRFLRTLLEPEVPLPDAFLREARQRVDRGEDPRFYDITAWSLPLLFDVDGYSSTDSHELRTRPATEEDVSAETSFPAERPAYAYLIDGRQSAGLGALYQLRAQGHRAAVSLMETRIAGQSFSSGTVIVRVGQNDDTVHEHLRELASRYRLHVRGVDTGHADEGYLSLGSGKVIPVETPEIAILAEQPVHAYSFGWAWYTLDQQFQISTTVRSVRSIAGTPLDRFNVLVIPDLFSADELGETLGEKGRDRLKRWIHDGGTLVALGAAVDFVKGKLELTALRNHYTLRKEAIDKAREAGEKDERPRERYSEPRRFRVPGAIFLARLDPEAWLSCGNPRELPVLVNSDRVYKIPDLPPDAKRRVVATLGDRVSGHAWKESLSSLRRAVFAYEERIGRGRVIAFPEDLNFRAYWRGANRLFLNAVILGPSAP